MFRRGVDIFLTYCLISSVWIITMIKSWTSLVDRIVGLDVFKIVVGCFKSLTRTILSSGFCNYFRMYASDSCWTSCTGTWLIFARSRYLRPYQNSPLIPWSLWYMMGMLGSWINRLDRHVLGDRLFWYGLLDRVLAPCFLHLIRLSQKHRWLFRHCCPRH